MWVVNGVHERMIFDFQKNTNNILKILAKYGANATFFVTGKVAEKHPEILRKLCRHEHEIASHGYSHRDFSRISSIEVERELTRSINVLAKYQEIVGFRAPYLVRNKVTYDACESLDMAYDSSEYGLAKYRPKGFKVMIVPVVPPMDTPALDFMRLSPESLVKSWLSEVAKTIGGAAICMHVWRIGREKYVQAILKPLLESGFTFLRARELLREDGIALTFDIEYTTSYEAIPQFLAVLKSPGWKYPQGLKANDF